MSLKIAGNLITSRRFLPLFAALQTGTFNDNSLKQALVVLVTYGGLSFFGIPQAVLVPLATTLFTLPFLLLSSTAGQVADKYDRGIVLRWIKRAEILIMLLAATGFLLENSIILMLALVCMGSQSAFFSPTKNSVLPQWLDDLELITGNAILNGFVFVFVLLGQVFGAFLILQSFGPVAISIILVILAVAGWLAAEQAPPAPPSEPSLKINFNIFTETIRMLQYAWKDQPVFRPMAGIAWFYGGSAILLAMLPNYVAEVLKYDVGVLMLIMIASTGGVLLGSLLCVVLTKGREAVWLSAVGVTGVSILALDLYLHAGSSGRTELGNVNDFLADPKGVRMLIDMIGASIFNGLFVVPLQAMSQRRADPLRRARLLAAGAIMLNLAVNGCQLLLVGMSAKGFPAEIPFLMISVISAFIAVYAITRTIQIARAQEA